MGDIKDMPTQASSGLIDDLKQHFRTPLRYSKSVLPFISKISKLEEEIALLTSYSSDTVYRLRYDTMRYDYISPAVIRLLGYSLAEMQKINFRSLILETKVITDSFRSINSYEQLEKARMCSDVKKWQADYLMKTKSGKKIWVTDISYPWINRNGDIIGSVGCLRDITDRVIAEKNIQDELVRLARTDGLTELANRRVFFEKLEEEFKRLNRNNSEFSVLVVDIDHFKKINDMQWA